MMFDDDKQERAIWLLSDGRSGSTWFGALLNHKRGFAEYFEPLHSHVSPELKGEALIPYAPPGHPPQLYLDFYSKVFSKNWTHDRAGPKNPLAKAVLVKDIHALLIANAIRPAFPQVDVVCLIRDPVEVARSKITLYDWVWFSNPAGLLANRELRSLLKAYETEIRAAASLFERYVMLWGIMYYVFKCQNTGADVVYVNYGNRDILKEKIELILGRAGEGPVDDVAFAASLDRRSTTDVRDREPYIPTDADRVYAEKVVELFGLADLLKL